MSVRETVTVCDNGEEWATRCSIQQILIKIKVFKISGLDFEIIFRNPEFGHFKSHVNFFSVLFIYFFRKKHSV